MPIRVYVILAFLLLGLPLVGYIWPAASYSGKEALERDWQWPTALAVKEVEPTPALLARFWPVQSSSASKEESNVEAKAGSASAATLKLVAIIRQGQQPQALVLTASGELKTLNEGDALDKTRRISAIHSNTVQWHSTDPSVNTPQGELNLYPQPPSVTTTLPIKTTQE